MPVSATTYLNTLSHHLARLDCEAIDRGVALIRDAWLGGRQVITLGNGGSALTALHFITDWSKMIPIATGKPFRGRSLLDNIGLITAYGNDIAFDDIFAEQVRNLASEGDLVLAISGSGNSENVIRAVELANRMGCITLGLCGFEGGRLRQAAQHVIWADVPDMQFSEDIHAIFGHIVMKALCGTPPAKTLAEA